MGGDFPLDELGPFLVETRVVAYILLDRVSEETLKRERQKAKALRQSQWWRQRLGQGLCHHCGQRFKKEDLTMDHLVPLSRGGRSTKANCVVSCKPCNAQKGHWTAGELALLKMNESPTTP